MGIKERRQREKDSQIKSILQATRDLARTNDWSEVSIRKIATKIEYTPPVIYEHFDSREDILIELEKQGFQKLKVRLDQAKDKEQMPSKQLLAMSHAYWDFAIDHFDLYHIMFNLHGTQSAIYDNLSLRTSAESVKSCLENLSLLPQDLDSIFFQWWATMHGFCAMQISQQLPGMKSQLKQYLRDSIERFIKSIQ